MLFLLLSILSSFVILVIFKVTEKHDIPVIHPIIINYFIASGLGYYNAGLTFEKVAEIPIEWYWPAAFVGSLFVFTFFLIGLSTRKAGIALTTVASKMSFVFPMFFSILIDDKDDYTHTKLLLLLMAMAAVYLTVYRKRKKTIESLFIVLLPFMLFVLLGLADSIVKFSQTYYIKNETDSSAFSFLTFGFSAIWSIALIFFQKKKLAILKPKTLLSGILIGLANFGSMYFLINALNALEINNSIVIALNNTGVVLASVIAALFIFREKLSLMNRFGIALSIATFAILMIFL
jgi:drug/metabolite transporter (DMT)-like permease